MKETSTTRRDCFAYIASACNKHHLDFFNVSETVCNISVFFVCSDCHIKASLSKYPSVE